MTHEPKVVHSAWFLSLLSLLATGSSCSFSFSTSQISVKVSKGIGDWQIPVADYTASLTAAGSGGEHPR